MQTKDLKSLKAYRDQLPKDQYVKLLVREFQQDYGSLRSDIWLLERRPDVIKQRFESPNPEMESVEDFIGVLKKMIDYHFEVITELHEVLADLEED
jgi:hypothetical protein